jgi:predicted aldo/keto reductase-like oxidoreductase
MNTDFLDLWQVHDVRTEEDIDQIFGPGGAMEAFVEAKERGFTRFVGVTGHHDPLILKRCIETYDFDTVLLPVNPAEPAHKSFIDTVVPLANEKGMGIVGMKVFFRGLAARVPEFESMEPYFRFALSQPISNVVIGCDNSRQLEENVNFAQSFQPMSQEDMKVLVEHISPYAKQLMYYKP